MLTISINRKFEHLRSSYIQRTALAL